MTKGEAYRQYYLANKERILEANKARARQRRDQRRESPVDAENYRDKQRQKGEERKVIHYKATLEALMEFHKTTKWSSFYAQLVNHPHLGYITPTIMAFLRNLSNVVEEEEQKTTVE